MFSGIRKIQFLLAIVGLGISVYLTLYHYAGIPLVCSASGLINCESVLNSPLSSVFGIPIAVLGLVFFGAELALLFIQNIDGVIIWNLIGVGSVIYFVYLESVIGKICIWCTGVHLVVVALFGLAAYELMKKVMI
jgi:uncharacterized membrane protein